MADRNRRVVLVTLAGLTPQVVTETLYALLCQRKPPERIDEVHVWTTRPGRERVERDLLDPRHGHFYRLCEEYEVDPMPAFDAERVHVFVGRDGRPLDDIRTVEDNEQVADQLVEFIRRCTLDPDVRLLCSLAGGRKTMSTYLAFALQFYGRPGDELLHVLVPTPFESHPDFFYPPRRPRELALPDGRRLSTEEAVIDLATVPVVFLRGRLPILNGRHALRFTELVQRVQADLRLQDEPPPLAIDPANRRVSIGAVEVHLPAMGLALYLLLARRRLSCPNPGCHGCARCMVRSTEIDSGFTRELAQVLEELGFRDPRYAELKRWRQAADRPAAFREVRSRVNRAIARALDGATWSAWYEIASVRSGAEPTLYGLRLASDRIQIR